MVRKSVLLISVIYFVALALLAMLLYRASPGPVSQEILGVGIGSHDDESGVVYLSGRRLNCDLSDGTQAFTSTCTVEISGKMLEIHARRNPATDPNQLGGTCEAFYDGQRWSCSIGSRHVHVHWFAYIREPLGFSGDQLEALRRQYFFENLPEGAFLAGVVVVPFVTMLLTVLAAALWLWPRTRRRITVALLVAASGVASLSVTFVLALLLTGGFWD
jgi:hypothetical protein